MFSRVKQLFVIFALVSFLITPASVSAKEYSISSVRVDGYLQSDGSMMVEERRTYNFTGDYTFAYQKIRSDGGSFDETGRILDYDLADFSLCEINNSSENCYQILGNNKLQEADATRPPGFYYAKQDSEGTYLKWFYRASDVSKDFLLRYTVSNAVTKQSDVDEIYWKIIGSDWEIGESNIEAYFHLPPGIDGTKIQAWAHGPLTGLVSIESPELIKYTVPSVPAGEFFEARLIVPQGTFSGGAPGSFSKSEIAA
ncbi:MAG: DUF2207 domain-containing protein, partial [bacterium]